MTMDLDTILFDMDGVLVDVSASYRTAIQKTVESFSGKEISFQTISEYKNRGGLNNDWDLSETLLFDLGLIVDKQEIIRTFQSFYLGEDNNGLIKNEKWLLDKEILLTLHNKYNLGIVTGRPGAEADYVLQHNCVKGYFSVIITMEDTPEGKGKPDPFGILLALKQLKTTKAAYLGDTIDDIKAAKSAGILPIGISGMGKSRENLKKTFQENGALRTIGSVNEIREILHENF